MVKQIQKVFIASTAYKGTGDVGPEIARFLKEDFGLEVVYYASPDFPVEKGLHSHDVCIEAVQGCDLFLVIIDIRFGGLYSGTKYTKYKTYNRIPMSITWAETSFAYDQGIPVHAFVRQEVWNARPDYKNAKKEKREHKSVHVDDNRVFEFIDFIVYKTNDNWIDQFNNVVDLKETLAKKFEGWTDLLATIPKKYLATVEKKRLDKHKEAIYLNPQGQYITPSLTLIETEGYISGAERERHTRYPSGRGEAPEGVSEAQQERVITRPTTLQELVSGNHARLAILADSGMGKTTLLEELMLMIANNKITTCLIPVYFHFSELKDTPDVFQRISTRFNDVKVNPAALDGYIKKTFSEGGFLFMVDGLDQLPVPSDPQPLLKEGGYLGNNKVIFTSRPYAYRAISTDLKGIKTVEMEYLEQEKIQDFLGQHYHNTEVSKIRDINPLLLQTPIFLAHIRGLLKDGKLVPDSIQTSSDLYKLVINKLLTHTISLHRHVGEITDRDTITGRLCKLSYHTLRLGHGGYFPAGIKDDLRKELDITLTEFDTLTHLGVLSQILEEHETSRYLFRHQSFQEYLASGELLSMLFEGDRLNRRALLEHIEYQRLDETLKFLAGREELRKEGARTLIDTIAQYDLFLSARCLSNVRYNKGDFEGIINALLEGLRDKDSNVRSSSARALGQIAGRMEEDRDKGVEALVKEVKEGVQLEGGEIRQVFQKAIEEIKKATKRRLLS